MPGSTKDDPGDPGSGTDRCDDIEVEPGGKTEVRQSECVAHEDADADVNWDVGEAHQDVQVKGESVGTCQASAREGESASAHNQVTDEQSDQHPSMNDDNAPEMPPAPPEPPDKAAQQGNEPPSTELKGEWKVPNSSLVLLVLPQNSQRDHSPELIASAFGQSPHTSVKSHHTSGSTRMYICLYFWVQLTTSQHTHFWYRPIHKTGTALLQQYN